MQYTTNYGLKKPGYTDPADIEDINQNMDTIDQELKNSGDHASSTSNPHGVTKAQIGLDSVSNYDVATKTEAEAGTSNTKFMTPLRVLEAIIKLAQDAIIEDQGTDPAYSSNTYKFVVINGELYLEVQS